jgi:hypothetical protein
MTVAMATFTQNNRKTLLAAGLGVSAIILLGVLSRYFALKQPVDESEATRLAEQTELISEQLQGQLTERLDLNTSSEEQARLDSPLGQAMLRQCLEWTALNENLPDDSSRQNRDLACKKHREFVMTGQSPE